MTTKPTDDDMRFLDDVTAQETGARSLSIAAQYRQWADEQIEKLRDICKRRDEQLNAGTDEMAKQRRMVTRMERGLASKSEHINELIGERDRARKALDDLRNEVANTSHAKKLLDAEAAVAAYKRENESLNAELTKQLRMVVDQDRQEEKLRRLLTDTRTELRRTMRERDELKGEVEPPAVTKMRDLSETLDAMSEKRKMAQMSTAELRDSAPKGKSFGDAHLGVIDECLTALKRIPSSERPGAVQYLLTRAHSSSWLTPTAPAMQAERPYEGF